MNRLSIMVGIICFLLLTACAKQQILDRITIFFACAFDDSPNDQIEFTLVAPKYHSKEPGTVSNQLLSRVGHTSIGIKESMELQLSRPINTGKISVVLFGKDLAAKGLSKELDVISRDAQASQMMYLAIVDGNARELLRSKFNLDEEKGMFLFNLLDSNVKNGLVPRQNLYEFQYAYFGKGIDPFLPLLKLQGDRVEIVGLALFKDDHYVTSINEKQMQLFKLLYQDVQQGNFEMDLGHHSHVAMKNVGSKVAYKVEKEKAETEITIQLIINGEIIDSVNNHLSNPNVLQLQRLFENDFAETAMSFIKLLKQKNIDPLGFGDLVRSKTRNWNEKEWLEQYSQLKVNLNVKVKLVETGVRK
ncbi:Ger(x)C family spore germination protein [Cohnella sp. GCM10020058]|uniref:Ger(x)C family spore germination protein n=1 Tax=Cohnella sp. GCM10020058 TaxID=3317330 RepID=UPI003629132B